MSGCLATIFIAAIIAEFFYCHLRRRLALTLGFFLRFLPDLHTKNLSPSLSSIVLIDPLFGA